MRSLVRMSFPALLLFLAYFAVGNLYADPANPTAEARERSLAKHGVLDLVAYDFELQGPVSLRGDWEFYWNELLYPADFLNQEKKPKAFRPVPANWKTYETDGAGLPLYGYATYRLLVYTRGNVNEYGLRLKRVYSAYRVFVNGNLVVETGSLQPRLEEIQAQLPVKTAFFSSTSPLLEIIIQVGNPYYYRSGILFPPELGTQQQISKKQVSALSADVFLLGVIAIMAAYFLVISFLTPDYRKSSLFFSLFCLVVGLRVMLITGERVLYQFFPDMSLLVDVRIQAFGIYLLIPSFLSVIYFMFPSQGNRKVLQFVVWASLAYLAVAVVGSPKLGGPILAAYYPFIIGGLGYMFVIVLRAIRAKAPHAKMECLGLLCIIFASAFDMLVDREIIHSDYVLSLGLLGFIFIQAVILSARFSLAFDRLKTLLEENQKIQGALETRVQERTSALRKLNENLILARNQAEEANSAKSRFLQNMSHEMRTPLNGILGYAELIQETDPKPIHGSYSGKVIEESRNLLDLINQLLDLSKIEAGKMKFEAQPFDLFELIRSVHDILIPLAEKKQLQFRVIIKETVPQYLVGDAPRLRQILVNLGGNAIKFTKTGWVEVKCECQERMKDTAVILFAIQDTGIGISRDFQQVIFERFTQAQAGTTRIYGGTGLGTTIAKQLTELMNGSIGLNSEEGKGSTFWVSIPFTVTTAEQVQLESEGGTASSGPSMQGHTVLLVEDYPTTQQITRHHLESAGINVVLAENGIKGIQSLGKHKVNCILMDVQMPQMDGLEATRLIRKLPDWGKIPIIGMTASAFEEDIQACLDVGMNDVLTKPLRKRDLLKKLAEHLLPQAEERETGPKKPNLDQPLRYEDFVKELGGDGENARVILEGFSVQLEVQRDRIVKALAAQDFETLHREAHAVKGGALNVFAFPLSKAAGELEAAAKREKPEGLDRLFGQFTEKAEEAVAAIRAILTRKN